MVVNSKGKRAGLIPIQAQSVRGQIQAQNQKPRFSKKIFAPILF